MHRASAAERLTAAELGTGHTKHVAQYPQKRRVAVDVDTLNAAVDFQLVSHGVLSCDRSTPIACVDFRRVPARARSSFPKDRQRTRAGDRWRAARRAR